MTFRRDLLKAVTLEPRSVSSIAHELGLKRDEIEEDMRHMIRSARAAGHQVIVDPARCRKCGFVFGEDKLSKPGKCPSCRGTWIYEARIRVEPAGQRDA
jgi:transcriptional regulator